MTTPATRRLVDRLGELKASIAIQTTEADTIVRKLKEKGLGVYSGVLFDANIYASERVTVDWKGLAAELGYTTAQRDSHSALSTIVTCKVTARLSR